MQVSDIFNEITNDLETPIPANVMLQQVSDLATQLVEAEKEIDNLEELIKAKKEAFRVLAERRIPEVMSAVGLKEFKLEDGTKITVKPYYMAKIDDENREACHAWLDQHGFADIIKHQIGVSLGKGESELANSVIQALEQIGVSYTDKEAVHWQTLVAFVREQIESGGDLPLDLFRVQIGQVAKIKGPK